MLSCPSARAMPGSRLAQLGLSVGLLTVSGFWAVTAMAELRPSTVELYALDGSAVVKGNLLEVSHGSYVVRTALGILRIGLDEAQCVGKACPLLDPFDADFAITGSNLELTSATSAVLARYADWLDAEHRIDAIDETSSQVTIIDNNTSEQLATIRLSLAAESEADDGESINGAGVADERGKALSVFAESQASASLGRDGPLTLGLEGVAVIAHPASPITLLSREQLARLFSCDEIELGDGGVLLGPLRLYSRRTSSAVYQIFKATVLDPLDVRLCDQVIQLPSDTDIATAVANDVGAIGIVSLRHRHNTKPLAIAECGLTHSPYAFGAKTEEYPLTQRILMMAPTLAESSAAAQKFIDFALSEIGQRQLEESGLIGLNTASTSAYASRYRISRIEAAAGTVQNTEVFGQLLVALEDAVRLSVTFRFDTGGPSISGQNGLDNRAQRDLVRLVNYLRTEAPDDAEILLFGFADATGDYDRNLVLSTARAESVANMLISLGVTPDVVAGFGEEGPIACNSDIAGRAKNRRVEVWLRLPEPLNEQRTIRITM